MQLSGKIIRQRFGSGTKSEHEAVMLVTDKGTYRLRRVGGNPFHDPELEQLVGHDIVCQGNIHRDTVLMDSWRVVEELGDS
jgi:hypothetical protein